MSPGQVLAMVKALVAMSGGVDSAVAALLCVEAGYAATGVTMLLRDEESAGGVKDREAASSLAARKVCDMLGIEHVVLDLRTEFAAIVLADFAAAYAAGLTPNPCVVCNPAIKFGVLMDRAAAHGGKLLATGHYARIHRCDNGRLTLRTAADQRKDQSYFLYRLGQQQLERAHFPLGSLTKEEVRSLATAARLPVAEARESQDICFAGPGGYLDVVRTYFPAALVPGPVVDVDGRQLGCHDGIAAYTVGQRRGLNLGGGEVRYVLGIDPERNAVIVGPLALALRTEFTIVDCRWLAVPELTEAMRAEVKLRHGMRRAGALVVPGARADTATVRLDSPQAGITPGQAAVFYRGDLLVGGGTIMPGRDAGLSTHA